MFQETKKPSTLSLLINLAIAAWGIYLFAKPGDLSTGRGIWAVVLIVFGGGMFLLGLLARFAKTESEAASEIDAMEREMYTRKHETKRVDGEATIRTYRLDRAFYQTRTMEVEALGFRSVGDYVDVTAERATPYMRGMVRSFIGDGNTTAGAVYDIRVRGFYRLIQLLGLIARDMRSVEFETEFDDGTFASTSNAVQASKMAEFPGISRLFLPLDATTRGLLDAHRAHVARLMNEKPPGTTLISIATFADLEASQDRMQVLKSQFRRAGQFDRVAETERIMGRPLTDAERRVAEDVAARQNPAVATEQAAQRGQAAREPTEWEDD